MVYPFGMPIIMAQIELSIEKGSNYMAKYKVA